MPRTAIKVAVIAVIFGLLFYYWPTSCLCHLPQRLDGQVALVTDGPSFMGQEIITELARRGATVLVGCQSQKHFDELRDRILHLYGENGVRVKLDFADERVRNTLTPIRKSQVS